MRDVRVVLAEVFGDKSPAAVNAIRKLVNTPEGSYLMNFLIAYCHADTTVFSPGDELQTHVNIGHNEVFLALGHILALSTDDLPKPKGKKNVDLRNK